MGLIALIGCFKEFWIIFGIIIFHEMGHFLVAKLFNWKIDKIYVYPFGGCVKFNESLNKPLKEELIIMLSGPLFQIILFLIISILYKSDLISLKNYLIFSNYHYSILIFNLLPAIPLDGGRLFNILMCYLTPFKKSMKYSCITAYFVFFFAIVYLVLFYQNYNLLILIIFLISKVYIENKNIDYLYNKFMLERYLNNYEFKKRKRIFDKNNLFKDNKHLIKDKIRFISEKEYLKNRFTKK